MFYVAFKPAWLLVLLTLLLSHEDAIAQDSGDTQDVMVFSPVNHGGQIEVVPTFITGSFFPERLVTNPWLKHQGGGLGVGYHLSERLSVELDAFVFQDRGVSDLKGLGKTVVLIAHTGSGGDDFGLPLSRQAASGMLDVSWRPMQAQVNFFDEAIVDVDVFVHGGFALLLQHRYNAVYDASLEGIPITLKDSGTDLTPAFHIESGADFFVHTNIAIRTSVHALLYNDPHPHPQYEFVLHSGPDEPVTESQLHTEVLSTAALAFFFR